MSRIPAIFVATALLAMAGDAVLWAPPSYADDSCAQELADVKEDRNMPGEGEFEPGPNMDMADKHIAAAEAAMQGGNDADCLKEVQEAKTWIEMESRRRKLKHN